MLAGNDNIHESLDEFDIWPEPTAGFHGNRYGWCLHFFSAFFHPFLSILAGNNDMYESSDEFDSWPDWTIDCGISCP